MVEKLDERDHQFVNEPVKDGRMATHALTERLHTSRALTRGATGRPVTHHRTYRLTLRDGRILRTRISRPVDRTRYSPSMWTHILRHQLEVTAPEFRECVHQRKVPDRGAPADRSIKKAVPLYLLRALADLGIAEADILKLDAAAAAALHARLLTHEHDE